MNNANHNPLGFLCTSTTSALFSVQSIAKPTNVCQHHKRTSNFHNRQDVASKAFVMSSSSSAVSKPDIKVEKKPLSNEVKDNFENMSLHFISRAVSVDGRSSNELRLHIEALLREEGDPIRWAIVEADVEKQTCRVDAVVSKYN